MLVVTQRLKIPLEEFEFTFARSSGPGGQNVNKVNSKAVLRWPVAASPALPPAVLARFLEKYGRRVTAEGDLVLASQRYRDQGRNVQDCLAKLRAMLAQAAVAPPRRRRTRPTRAAVERRLRNKRTQSRKKENRQGLLSDD